ncbi:MAG: GNAT family acetyltransferase, partial [SAR324 cluster bacterium]|nr:GNAT family acetyltransferase [SAR324 cluster bacterium]
SMCSIQTMHDAIEIRSFQLEDEFPLIKLWVKCQLVVAWNDPSKDISRKVQLDLEGLLLDWHDNSLIASVMAGYEGHRGWINYLAVEPEFRRKGLGKTMMKAAETYLEQFECPKINLQIRAQNHQVIEFYKSIGFLQEDVINMGKRLIPDLK